MSLSSSESSRPVPKWVILYRQRADDPWMLHKHHKGTTFRYDGIDKTSDTGRRMKSRGLQAMSVREDRCFDAYGITP